MQSKQHLEEFVINFLKTNLPPFYYYHNYEHSLYVMEKVVEIGQQENCTASEIELLKAAALWHDAGYIKSYANHEAEGCVLAWKYLPGFGFGIADITTICGMIMATKIPQSPTNKLEEIIADADLEYLGTKEAAIKAHLFFKELQHLDPSLTKAEWNKTQISFLQNHHYFTAFCRQYKEPAKFEYLAHLINPG
ncbi:MAG: HD domain-containing protein [Chitinophagaceae bacterium]|nr:HD domain-containing protein [Chitinophagaceae bacterium]